ncbi:MAG: Penicillin-binding protein 2 (PBP-2), partial [Parcubacteria group bacterium Gr01-1014_66]
ILMDSENLPRFDTTRFEGVLERPIPIHAFWGLGGIFVVIGALLVVRAAYLMMVAGDAYAKRAEDNRLVHHMIIPERGAILDRTGKPLAFNVPGFRVVVDTRGVPKETLLPRMRSLAEELKRDGRELTALIEQHWAQGEIVIDLIREWETANRLLTRFKDEPAIRIEPTPLRAYDEHPAFGHVVGYVGALTKEDLARDSSMLGWSETGKTSIERAYDEVLRGNTGIKIVETNSQGEVLSAGIFQKEERGGSVTLSISADLQKVIYTAIGRIIEDRGFQGGSAVALKADTGEVLALVSYPGFNANSMSTGVPREEVLKILTDEHKPLFPRALAGLYPPASTVKPFLAAAAIDEKIVDPETVIYTEGRIVVPNPFDPDRPTVFKDWKNHGPVNMVRAIAVSSDAYFYTIGGGHGRIEGLGVEKMYSYFRIFGMGERTGIDLLGEEDGFVPNKEWKSKEYPNDPLWRLGDSYNMSIGQGWMLATPLQLARSTLAIAREGMLYQPRLVKAISTKSIDVPLPTPLSISKEALRIARLGMRSAVTDGTASGVADIRPLVAAKTGTAEVDISGRTHSWFIGFLPWDSPELVLVINLENGPAGNLIGATAAAHEVLQWFSTDYIDKNSPDR